MIQDEVPASSRGPDQVWFSMLMVNDPNAALFGSLRPARPHPILAAMRRPFERLAPTAPRPVHEEEEPALRPRRSRWVAAALAAGLVALGFGLTETVLEQLTTTDSPRVAAAAPGRIGSTTLAALPASMAPRVGSAASVGAASTAAAPTVRAPLGTPAIAVNVAARAAEPSAPPRADANLASSAARTPEKSARSTTSVKKKAAARQRKAAFGRALAVRKASQR